MLNDKPISLSSLVYYPIKACRGFELTSAYVERGGLEHDRRMMVTTPEGRFLTQREFPKLALVTPTLADGVLNLSAPGFDPVRLSVKSNGSSQSVKIWKSDGVQAVDQGEESAQWF
jgi:uncharacterized protein YcbX